MSKILSLKNLKTFLAKNSKLNIVLATGCFDLLHQAHFDFLKFAKSKGDVLIIGLEQDKRVKKLKGLNRPINKWPKRAKNLACLKEIDFIFPLPEQFSQKKEHLKLLKLIKPNVFALSENTPFLKAKKELIKTIGSKMAVFSYNPYYSTSKLILAKNLIKATKSAGIKKSS